MRIPIDKYYKLQSLKFSKCLYPGSECENKAISAHSIQNRKIFDLLESDNHVITIKSKFGSNHIPIPEYVTLGRNKASTFLGLCSAHDSALFEPIDKTNLKLDNKEQLFLIAYRSVLKELHACIERGIKLQVGYQELIRNGKLPADQPTDEGLRAVEYFAIAYETQVYKEKYDKALLNNDFDAIVHKPIIFDNVSPSVACSQLFSVDKIKFENDVLRIVLNIIPMDENKTIAIFSFTKEEKQLAEDFLSKYIYGHEFTLKYNISKLVIEVSDNFYLSPKHFNNWSKQKKSNILNHFEETILENYERESSDYYLFNDK